MPDPGVAMKPMTGFRLSAPLRWSLRISAFLFIALAYGANRSRPAGGIELDFFAALGEGLVVSAYLHLLFYCLLLSLHWLADRISGRGGLGGRTTD